ncbi:MAG: hypothetical protein ACI9W0_002186, partial [Gammaproteobacteria bacterium]
AGMTKTKTTLFTTIQIILERNEGCEHDRSCWA